MDKELKTLRRTVVLEAWTNRFDREALREIERAYKEMLRKTLDYALKTMLPKRLLVW